MRNLVCFLIGHCNDECNITIKDKEILTYSLCGRCYEKSIPDELLIDTMKKGFEILK